MTQVSLLLEALATLSGGLFAGAALYISLVEQPARMECGIEVAVTEFGPSYRRAARLQATLAAVGFLAAIIASLLDRSPLVLVGGLLLGSVIPFTLLVIYPTNERLLDPALDRRSEQAKTLLDRWGRLHAVRSVLGMLAFGVLLWHGMESS
jgi:Anthrone oxygenase